MNPKRKIFYTLTILLGLSVIFSKILRIEPGLVFAFRALFFSCLFFLYKIENIGKKNSALYYFFLIYAVNELAGAIIYLPQVSEAVYTFVFYFCNFLYIFSYLIVLYSFIKSFNSKAVLKKAALSFVVISLFGVYLGYNTAKIALESTSDQGFVLMDHILLVFYVVVLVCILITSLLNYILNEGDKELLYFLGFLCIVFSEVIQITTLYHLTELYAYGVSYTILLISGFLLVHRYTLLKTSKN